MTLQSGSLAITNFRVLGSSSEAKLTDLNRLIGCYHAPEIRIGKGDRELAVGWVAPEHADAESLGSTAHWDMSTCQLLGGYLMRFRIDKRRVPSALLQWILRERLLKAADDQKAPLARKDRKALRDQTKAELLAHALPQISFADVFWRNDHLLLFSTSKSVKEQFLELFHKTFAKDLKLSVIQITPPLQGLGQDDWTDIAHQESPRIGRLTQTVPSSFA